MKKAKTFFRSTAQVFASTIYYIFFDDPCTFKEVLMVFLVTTVLFISFLFYLFFIYQEETKGGKL